MFYPCNSFTFHYVLISNVYEKNNHFYFSFIKYFIASSTPIIMFTFVFTRDKRKHSLKFVRNKTNQYEDKREKLDKSFIDFVVVALIMLFEHYKIISQNPSEA